MIELREKVKQLQADKEENTYKQLLGFEPNDSEFEDLCMIINSGIDETDFVSDRLKLSLYQFTEKIMGSKSFGQKEFEHKTNPTQDNLASVKSHMGRENDDKANAIISKWPRWKKQFIGCFRNSSSKYIIKD